MGGGGVVRGGKKEQTIERLAACHDTTHTPGQLLPHPRTPTHPQHMLLVTQVVLWQRTLPLQTVSAPRSVD